MTDGEDDVTLEEGEQPPDGPELTKNDDHLVDMLIKPRPSGIGDVVKYDFSRSAWHYWNGLRWKIDGTDHVYEMIRAKAASWVKNAKSQEKRRELLPLLNYAKKSAVLDSLAFREGIAMNGDEWDTQPHLIGCQNGVVDLTSGELFTHPDPEWLITRSVKAKLDTEADCPVFVNFLREIMSGDEEMVGYLLLLLGYTLWGHQREQKFWMWSGEGNNGKGALARTMLNVLGDYAHHPSDELYMRGKFGATQSSAPRADLMKLQGVRFTFMSEPQGGSFNDEMVKSHTGDDPITARDLYAKSKFITTFRPTHTIIFLCNMLPKTEDVGASMRRRARVIKFMEDFSMPPWTLDPDLEDKMKLEMDGIFALLVRAAGQYAEMRMPEPAKVREWSRQYIEDNDPLSQFLQACCVDDREARANATLLYEAYKEWCAREGIEAYSQSGFGSLIGRRYTKHRTNSGYIYKGIGLLSAMKQAEMEADDGPD